MPPSPAIAPIAPPAPVPSADAVLSSALQRLIPKEFAERLITTRGQVSSERRLVTLLFSDVKGSTAMADQLDPEDVMDIMNGAFDVLIPPIYRHEGTLARLMGDAILAFFGAPLAHEDDAARAIRAALEIVAGAREYAARLERERGIPGFTVRVGISTGLVVVGEVGTDLRVEYTAMGDAINLAARLEQNAPEGGILISHDTYQLVRGLFDVQALGPITVKGKAEPVRVYTVQGARPRTFRMARRGVEGVETHMVGREAELKRLQDTFYVAAKDARCQVVTVVGEAGVGKTRLLWEFENWLDGVPQSTRHFHARANREQQGVPYALLRDLFVLRFDIQESDPAETARAKLEVGIGRLLGQDEQGQMKAHLIGQLLGFDFSHSPFVQEVRDDARQLRDRVLIYLEEYLRATAASGTAVALFEDVHWADGSSLDIIATLPAMLAHQRLLIVCLTRPTLFEYRPQWGEGLPSHTRIDLQPLSAHDSCLLVDEILIKMEQVPPVLRDMVVAASEGNPLYVEEVINVLIDQGVIARASEGQGPWSLDESRLTELRVPPTLTAVLQARLDGLPLEQRATLQQAAVVGHTFWDRVVARIAERSGDAEVPGLLSALHSRELVVRHETSAFAGSQELAFKHAALRQVAYESILKKVRRGYHSLVGDWLIEQSGERVGEYTGLIAEHLELAGRVEEAVGYLRRAGGQAAGRYANAEAVGYYTRALKLLDHADWEPRRLAEARYGLLLGREAVYHLLGRRAEQAGDLTALTALATEGSGSAPGAPAEEGGAALVRRAEVAWRQAGYHAVLGDYGAQLASGQESVSWAEQAEDPVGVARGLIECGIALGDLGQFGQAHELLERALALTREQDDRAVEASALNNLGIVAAKEGDPQAARPRLEQALQIFRDMGARRDEARGFNNLANVFLALGDLGRARDQYERALAIYRGVGARHGEIYALGGLADVYEQVGALEQARDMNERALAMARLLGDRGRQANRLCNLGSVSLSLGDAAAARQQCEEGLALCRQTGNRRGEGYSLTALGFALAELGELDAAAASFEEALRLRRDLGMEAPMVDDLAGLAKVAGQAGVAVARAREGLAWMAAHGADGVEYPVRDYLIAADVLAAAGQAEEAAAARAAARALVEERAGRISDPEIRTSFENMSLHARVLRETP